MNDYAQGAGVCGMDENNVKPTKQEAQAIAEKIFGDIINTFEACGCKDPWNLIKEALKASAGYEHDIKTAIHEDLFLAPDPMLGKLQGQTPKDPIFEIINSKQPAFQGEQVFRYRNEIVFLKMRYTFEKLKDLINETKDNKVAFEAVAELAAQCVDSGIQPPKEMRVFITDFFREKLKKPGGKKGKCPYSNLWRDYAIIQCFYALIAKGYEPLYQSSTKHEDSATAIIAQIV
ncbi:MAG: hypothetical protein QMD09_13785, partial [Desulfatibacillaceae bacterium]|nr:hypothetical protein [Desulfatibacillaceae bacterium]